MLRSDVYKRQGVSNTTVTMNAASMNNSGFEFAATYRNRDHDFKYEVSANLSTVRIALFDSSKMVIRGNLALEEGNACSTLPYGLSMFAMTGCKSII